MNIIVLRKSIYTYTEVIHTRSGGPGGQNVNKVNTKVTLRISLNKLSGLSFEEKDQLKRALTHRITCDGEIMVSASENRLQKINLESAFSKMEKLIVLSACLPKKRKPTNPSKAVKEKRHHSKQIHSLKKQSRSHQPTSGF